MLTYREADEYTAPDVEAALITALRAVLDSPKDSR